MAEEQAAATTEAAEPQFVISASILKIHRLSLQTALLSTRKTGSQILIYNLTLK